MIRSLTIVGAACLIAGLAHPVEAQLFGPRTLGQPFQGRRSNAGPATASDAGVLEGNERFLRGNRSRSAFVGADRQSQQGFVGAEQAIGSGQVRAATETLRPPPDASRRINRPVPPLPAEAMYYPRLVVDFEVPKRQPNSGQAAGGRGEPPSLSQRLSKLAGSPVVVHREGDLTVLAGRIESVELAEKLLLIASFEPEVDALESRLVVGR